MSEKKECKLYKLPDWSENPKFNFNLDILKNGVIIGNIDLSQQDHYIFGIKLIIFNR